MMRAVIVSAAFYSLVAAVVGGATSMDDLDKAVLDDIIQSYITHEATTCNTPEQASATSFSFNWPGTNTQSSWNTDFTGYEQGLFQAIMSYNDPTGNRSWSIRIGSGGNMYSIIYPDLFGEVIPPQEHINAPWIDEVHQMVAVPLALNGNDNCYMHQAGAYQLDPPYTNTPFFSPILAKHCSQNSCTFASWGTQAWVATQYTSPVIYINRYTNCNNGIIEHTQMIHNFINPSDTLNNPNNDLTFIDVPWAGVRPSKLPYALEPSTATSLNFNNVNTVDYLPLCKWGNNHDNPNQNPNLAGRAKVLDLSSTQGYTTFVAGGLLVNQTSGLRDISLPCRKSGTAGNCYTYASTCMVASCTNTQVSEGYTRIELKVAANSPAGCVPHNNQAQWWNGLVLLQCDFHDTGFGQSKWPLTSYDSCSPWTDIGLFNSRTGRGVHVAYLRHWSFLPNDKKLWFAVYSTDGWGAASVVNDIFHNVGNADLSIVLRPLRKSSAFPMVEATSLTKLPLASVPEGYNPSNLAAFTYVYGKGEDYVPSIVEGRGRRRVGSTDNAKGRDYTVFVINWHNGARLEPSSTYTNRGYYFASNLGSVHETAGSLRSKVAIDEIALEDWSPRRLDIYESSSKFIIKAASSSGGQSAMCASSSASLVCSGWSTPKEGHVPYFYVKCQNATYFGPNPYKFTPSFGSKFPGHGNATNQEFVRSYVCDVMTGSGRKRLLTRQASDDYVTDDDATVTSFSDGGNSSSFRPTWKLAGFFPINNCTLLETSTYNESVCNPDPTSAPTPKPSFSPSSKPTSKPSFCIPNDTRMIWYGLSCACAYPWCWGEDTTGMCCSRYCRVTSRGVSMCKWRG